MSDPKIVLRFKARSRAIRMAQALGLILAAVPLSVIVVSAASVIFILKTTLEGLVALIWYSWATIENNWRT